MPPRKGGVFMVYDKVINLPPDASRQMHNQRPSIIVSGDATNAESAWPTVLVVPTSTQSALASEYCVELAKGIGNLPKKCWARVVLVQPVAKADLRDFLGKIPAIELELLEQNLLAYMGSID